MSKSFAPSYQRSTLVSSSSTGSTTLFQHVSAVTHGESLSSSNACSSFRCCLFSGSFQSLLAAHDRPNECFTVLQRLRCNEDQVVVQRLHGEILQSVAYEASIAAGSWKDLLQNDHIKSQRRLLIACAIQSFQQLGGINAIIYYSGTLFEKSIGFDAHMSSLMSGFLQTWFFVASFIPWFLIDRIGRAFGKSLS
jgi:hypothetical protein